jgi:signal transduction histidine kinase
MAVWILGGGVPKNFVQDTVVCAEVLGIEAEMHKYAVQITVADNGPGLSPEVKASVFERFSAKSRAGARAGAGLGLALVNRFLELHDGWVEIESGAPSSGSGGGTVVRCHLPRRIQPGDDHPPQSEDKRTAYL